MDTSSRQAMKHQIKLFGLPLIAVAVVGVLIWQGYAAEWTGFGQYTGPVVYKSKTFTRAKTLWDWLQLLVIPVALAFGVFWLNHEDAKQKLAATIGGRRRIKSLQRTPRESMRLQVTLTQSPSYSWNLACVLLSQRARSERLPAPIQSRWSADSTGNVRARYFSSSTARTSSPTRLIQTRSSNLLARISPTSSIVMVRPKFGG